MQDNQSLSFNILARALQALSGPYYQSVCLSVCLSVYLCVHNFDAIDISRTKRFRGSYSKVPTARR